MEVVTAQDIVGGSSRTQQTQEIPTNRVTGNEGGKLSPPLNPTEKDKEGVEPLDANYSAVNEAMQDTYL